MGSGLILLVIVGAWLVVLVPMALRSYDGSGSLGTVDKFHDAMRVLARRDTRTPVGEATDEGACDPPPRPPGGGSRAPAPARSGPEPVPSPAVRSARAVAAARRRRLLVALFVLSAASLVGGLLGPLWLLVPHLLLDLLLGGLLVHLRRAAIARAERDWRAAMQARPAARPAGQPIPRPAARPVARPAYVAGVPDRMPSRAVLLGLPAGVLRRELPAPPAVAPAASRLAPGFASRAARDQDPAARDQDPAAPRRVRGAQGAAWLPVPVPAPIYLSTSTARRTAAGSTAAADAGRLADAERDLGIVDGGPPLDEILDRRAVND